MSFDIFLSTCNLGNTKKKAKDPFTGKVVEITADDGMTAAEHKAVLAAVKKAKPKCVGGMYSVKLSDGGVAEIQLDDYEPGEASGGLISLGDLSPQMADLIYNIAHAGNLIVMPAMEPPTVAITRAEHLSKVKKRHPECVVVGSGAELRVLLTDGIKAWQKYCRQVVKSK